MVDGGDLDCGSGLLLIIRNALQPVPPGGVLEVRSRESSVREDLPAWCRMVGHAIVATTEAPADYTHYSLRKKGDDVDLAGDLEEARNYAWKVRARWTEGCAPRCSRAITAGRRGNRRASTTEDAAPSAIEQLLGALASCLAVGLQWRASKEGIAVSDLEVTLAARSENILVFLGVEDSGSPGLASITGKLFLRGDGDPDRIEQLWQETCRRSPLLASLENPVPVEIDFRVM